MVNDELLRGIVRLSNSAQELAVNIKWHCPKAENQAMNVCLEIQRLFNKVYDIEGGAFNG